MFFFSMISSTILEIANRFNTSLLVKKDFQKYFKSFDVVLKLEETEAISILLFSNNFVFKERIPKHSEIK